MREKFDTVFGLEGTLAAPLDIFTGSWGLNPTRFQALWISSTLCGRILSPDKLTLEERKRMM
jgi:hypothetical protein